MTQQTLPEWSWIHDFVHGFGYLHNGTGRHLWARQVARHLSLPLGRTPLNYLDDLWARMQPYVQADAERVRRTCRPVIAPLRLHAPNWPGPLPDIRDVLAANSLRDPVTERSDD